MTTTESAGMDRNQINAKIRHAARRRTQWEVREESLRRQLREAQGQVRHWEHEGSKHAALLADQENRR